MSQNTSKLLEKARIYEAEALKTTSENQRPKVHLSSPVGWINDPNGFSYYNGKYHMFFQYYPYAKHWGPMHWGHAVSDDCLSWDYLPCAIAPDTDYDSFGCYSGSALTDNDGNHALVYTSVRKTLCEDGIERDIQTQSVAFGDGLEYEKYRENPVIDSSLLPAGMSPYDFRDPKAYKTANGYEMVVSARSGDGSSALLVYRSSNLKKWDFVKILDRSENQLGRMWECPDFFFLDGKAAEIICPQEVIGDGNELKDGNNTVLIAGHIDSESGKLQREYLKSLDYGTDFYASQTLETADGRRILVGWLQNWATSDETDPKLPWFGQCTLPRELTLIDTDDGLKLLQKPLSELKTHETDSISAEYSLCDSTVYPVELSGRNARHKITLSFDPNTLNLFSMKLFKAADSFVLLTYNPHTGMLALDRTQTGFSERKAESVCSCKVVAGEGVCTLDLDIILDTFSVEVFANNYECVMSMAVYGDNTPAGVEFSALGSCLLSDTKTTLN